MTISANYNSFFMNLLMSPINLYKCNTLNPQMSKGLFILWIMFLNKFYYIEQYF